MDKTSRQRIRYLRTADGVQLAWAEAGAGPLLVKAANWLTHLEYDWESPVWRHWIRFFADHFRFVRYDERGCGMTDWNVGDLSLERWVEDLEAVVDAAAPARAVRAARHLAGRGRLHRLRRAPSRSASRASCSTAATRAASPAAATRRAERIYRAIIELARLGWGKDNPAFRQVFTSRFIPGGTDEQIGWFNELCRKTTSPEIAARLLESRAQIDVTDLLPRVRTPDARAARARRRRRSRSRRAAGSPPGIPGAQFVELDSKNHVLLENEPAWERFREAVLEFVGLSAPGRRGPGVRVALAARARDPGAHHRGPRQRRDRASASRSARRRSATTSRTSSTSSACGRAPRPSSSPATAASATDAGQDPLDDALEQERQEDLEALEGDVAAQLGARGWRGRSGTGCTCTARRGPRCGRSSSWLPRASR